MVQFRAGSYQLETGFVRSIERRSGSNGTWNDSMVLINFNTSSEDAESVAIHAKSDIDTARQRALDSQGASTIDHELVKLGYNRLESK